MQNHVKFSRLDFTNIESKVIYGPQIYDELKIYIIHL